MANVTSDNSSQNSIAVSVKTGAKMIGLCRTSFYSLLKAGKIKSVRIGGRVLIPVSELTVLIDRLQQVDGAKPSPSRSIR